MWITIIITIIGLIIQVIQWLSGLRIDGKMPTIRQKATLEQLLLECDRLKGTAALMGIYSAEQSDNTGVYED